MRDFASLIIYETKGNKSSRQRPRWSFLSVKLGLHLATFMGNVGLVPLSHLRARASQSGVPWLRAVHVRKRM